MHSFLRLTLCLSLLLAACAAPSPSPIPPTSTATHTLAPAATPTATATALPTFTPEPSATPDRLASFEIPADHAPIWGFRDDVSKKLVTLEGANYALYRAMFQPYLIDARIEMIGNNQVLTATGVYEVNDRIKKVDVVFDPNFTVYGSWGDKKTTAGLKDEMIPIEKLQHDIQSFIEQAIQVPLTVVVGYGGIPTEVKERNCTQIECQVVDELFRAIKPDDLLNFYISGGEVFPNQGQLRLLVSVVGLDQNDLESEYQISDWPADQVRQFPFAP